MPDRLYLTLSEGPDSADARPFLTVDDPVLLRDVVQAIVRRLGVGDARVRALRSLPTGAEKERE